MAFLGGFQPLGRVHGVRSRGSERRMCCAAVMSEEKTSTSSVRPERQMWLDSIMESRVGGHASGLLMQETRDRGEEELAGLAPPNSKMEEWRFTNLSPLYSKRFTRPAGVMDVDVTAFFSNDAGGTVVILDGEVCLELSDLSGLPEQMYVGSISDLPDREEAQRLVQLMMEKEVGAREGGFFAKLNAACLTDALAVIVPGGLEVEKPVQVIIASSSPEAKDRFVTSHPRIVVSADRTSKVSVVEHHVSKGNSFTNCCATLDVNDGANVSYVIVNETGDQAFQFSTLYGNVGRDATAEVVAVQTGSTVSKTMIYLDMLQSGAHAAVNGFCLAHGRRVSDLTSRITHNAENCTSSQLQKNIATDRGRTVFRGKIKVTEEGDGTSSEQLCRSLLLSKTATVDAMPVLEIDTDDVQCSHGATVADLEDEQIFYCCSRGLSVEEARFLLISSFAEDVLKTLPLQDCKRRIVEKVNDIVPQINLVQERIKYYSSA